MLRLPRLGPPERRSPASSVLSEHYDFLHRIRSRLSIRFSAPTDPLRVRSRAAERSAGPGPVQARYRWLISAGQTQDLPGSWRIHPISLPRSQIPAGSSVLTLSARQCCPHLTDGEGTSKKGMSRFNHAALISAAYASSDALPHPHARLASGWWLALAGWESNPLDSIEKVSVRYIELPPFPGLSWRYGKHPQGMRLDICEHPVSTPADPSRFQAIRALSSLSDQAGSASRSAIALKKSTSAGFRAACRLNPALRLAQ